MSAPTAGCTGTVYSYRKGCRCARCRTANYRSQQAWRERVRNTGQMPARAHGTLNGYRVYGCRCKRCTRVNSVYIQRLRDGRRRMRELVDAGLPRDYQGKI